MGDWGHICFPYIDDSFIVAQSKSECEWAVSDLTKLFQKLGFTINKVKSQLIPDNKLNFLGFLIDSELMTVSLPIDKKDKLLGACWDKVNRLLEK